MAEEFETRVSSRRLGGVVLTSIGIAVLVAALAAGIWYFLRGSRERRTPETPQTTSRQWQHRAVRISAWVCS